jgi:hypothetical protein
MVSVGQDECVHLMEPWPHLPAKPDPHAPLLPEWWGPPEQVLGVIVPVDRVLVRREQLFVGLRSLVAYRTGLILEVAAAVRRGAFDEEHWQNAKASIRHSVGGGPSGRGRIPRRRRAGRRSPGLD